MDSLNDYIKEYQSLLEMGKIQVAYKGLIRYMLDLRNHFKKNHPDFFVSGHIYQGYMDLSFFGCRPAVLKDQKLKIAIVLNHEDLQFEVWLCGYNKAIQKKYWDIFKNSHWNKYHVPTDIKGIYSIVEHVLVDQPYFDNLEELTQQIEEQALIFMDDILTFLDEVED
jgi:hypothetical protein